MGIAVVVMSAGEMTERSERLNGEEQQGAKKISSNLQSGEKKRTIHS
jgi:hypothetical protein